ncbi:MAG TPA: hypothetical protein VGN72_21775 [Tepidisphaeraceae bacterium]|jgi:hypothetical protein|nr:hypothetical protein [Tepidisphaeraceae bacterium]
MDQPATAPELIAAGSAQRHDESLLALVRLSVRRVSPPPGWRSVAKWVLLSNTLVILLCVALSEWIYGNNHRLFGEKHLGTLAAVGVLVASGVVSLNIAKRLPQTKVRQFWMSFGVLLCVVAFDDMFRLHERIDRWIHAAMSWNPHDRMTDHIDDVLVLSYVVPAFYLAWRHRLVLARATLMVQMLGVAVVTFIVHVAYDMFGWGAAIEEILKLTAGCFILLAVLAVGLDTRLLRAWNARRPA